MKPASALSAVESPLPEVVIKKFNVLRSFTVIDNFGDLSIHGDFEEHSVDPDGNTVATKPIDGRALAGDKLSDEVKAALVVVGNALASEK